MNIVFTPAARGQLRTALVALGRRDRAAAQGLRDEVASAFGDPAAWVARGAALPEFADLPFREVRMGSYRFFFRTETETVWIAGVWPEQKDV